VEGAVVVINASIPRTCAQTLKEWTPGAKRIGVVGAGTASNLPMARIPTALDELTEIPTTMASA
jgi:hypothetical protein